MKGKRLRSFSGTVLIMVLTVMLVLIIMLMATLTVVTTASQRIYTKYEENQAYYTARSALDVFTSSMLSDAAYYAYKDGGTTVRDYLYTDVSVSPSVNKTVSNAMKQGTALQLDLYKIRSQNDDGIDLKYAENPIDTDKVFVLDAGQENNNNNYSLNSSDSYTKDGITYDGLEYIEYDVMLPMVDDGSNKYGKMVDTDFNDEDDDGVKDDQIARIRVEVLDRKLATEPSYTTQQINDYIGGDTSLIADDPAFKAAIAKGSRSKDYMKIKITSTVKMMDVEGVAVVVFETTEKDSPANEQALTTSGTASGRGGSSPSLQGGFSTMATDATKLVSGDQISGIIFSLGSFETDTANNTLNLSEGSSLVAMKGLTIPSSSTTIKATDKNRFMFLGGTSQFYGNIGDSTNGISTIANEIKIGSNSSTLNYYGNIYANKIILGGSGSSHHIYDGSTYANEIEVPAEWFWTDDDGNINMTMDGADAFNNLNATLNNGFIIHDVYNSFVLTSSNIGDVICQNGRTLTYSTQTFNKIDFSNDPTVGTYTIVDNDGQLYRQYKNLPFNIDNKNEIEVPTPQAFFKDYYVDGAFNPASGDLGLYVDGSGTIDYSVTDYDTIYDEDNNVIKILKTGAYLLEDYLADGSESYVRKNSINALVSSDPTKYPKWTDAMSATPIDLSGGDKFYVLDGTFYSPIKVQGNGGRLIFLIPENTTAKFDGIGSGFTLTTEEIDASNTNIVNATTKAPKVDIYGGTDSKLELGNKCTLAGYVIMPTGDMKVENGCLNMSYDGEAASNTCIVGSILCRSFDAGNHPSILYLDKNSGAESPGEPHLSVKASQYTRS